MIAQGVRLRSVVTLESAFTVLTFAATVRASAAVSRDSAAVVFARVSVVVMTHLRPVNIARTRIVSHFYSDRT